MRHLSLAKQFTMMLLALLIPFSCTEDGEQDRPQYLIDDYYVGLSIIEEIASDIYFPNDGSSSLKSTEHQTKSVQSIDEIKNTSGETLFYIVNYDEGGFILLSSDKRSIPVLAYSTDNNFEVHEYTYPPGLKIWMDDAKKQM